MPLFQKFPEFQKFPASKQMFLQAFIFLPTAFQDFLKVQVAVLPGMVKKN